MLLYTKGDTIMNYGFLKLALCTPNLSVGATSYNAEQIKNCIKQADKQKSEIAVFGGLSLTGSTLGSMAVYNAVLDGAKDSLQDIVTFSKSVSPIIIVGLPLLIGGRVENTCAVIKGGDLIAIVPENDTLASSVTLFGNEYPLDSHTLFDIANLGFKFSVVFGEDFDRIIPSSQIQAVAGADLVINISSSVALIDSLDDRINKLTALSKKLSINYAYVSTGDGESVSSNVFSGDKIALECGKLIVSAEGDDDSIVFAELDMEDARNQKIINDKIEYANLPTISVKITNNNQPPSRRIDRLPFVPKSAEFSRIIDIMGRGIRTRMKEAKVDKVILGLSGGLDSSMVLLTCCKMAEKYDIPLKNIIAVTMPSDSSSSRTQSNSSKLIDFLGVTGMEVPIRNALESHMRDIGHDCTTDVTYENAQARERTQIVLDLANKHGALMLGTGDLSEVALGWSTYGGDQLAQYNPNSSLTKTLIRAIIRNYSLTMQDKDIAVVLNDILATPISPELKPNQETEQIIGPYEIHDFFLYNLIGKGFDPEKVLALAFVGFAEIDKKQIAKYLRIFITRFFANQFKRTSACDGVQLTAFDLSDKVIHSEFSHEQFIANLDKAESKLFATKKK